MTKVNEIIQTSTQAVSTLFQEQKKGVLSRIKDFFFNLLGHITPDQFVASRLKDITNSLSQKEQRLTHLTQKLAKLNEIKEKQSFVSLRSRISLENRIKEVETKIKEIEEQTERKIEKQVARIIRAPLFQEGDERFDKEDVCKKTMAFYEQALLLEMLSPKQRIAVIDQMVAIKHQQIFLLTKETTGTRSLADQKAQLESEIESLEHKKSSIQA